ncbi:MAG: hypothetical protein ACKVLD_07140 [Flavobacteriales bacterium]|jgi:hypothetical protein|nr:hypothetical protein [Flavobacteriales bacterium]|tara:strand:- start:73 stop:1215 length:1143 start_codon:yes stop_codon:yes gene_type:complete
MKNIFRAFGYPEVVWFPKSEHNFLTFICLSFIAVMFITPYPQYAMWAGFLFAAYAAIANDSIQTLGTFIASNQDKRWWVLWIFVGGIFFFTMFYSWMTLGGDVSHGRLTSKGFEIAPTEFHFLQIAAPIFLLILTRLRMPVSTTFILLTSFAASPAAVGGVLAKSMSGYILSFMMGLIFFLIVAKSAKKYFTGKANFGWTIAQWITSGTLWSVWLMQDAANIAVYLPRSLNVWEFSGFTGVVIIGLGLLLYYKGGRIQKIVTEKSIVTDVRFATLIDFIYCIILFYFKLHSKVPMSTTWVFIGLLAGRELGMAIMNSGENSILKSIKLGLKDMLYALIGLIISIAIAIGVNDQLTVASMFTTIPEEFAAGVIKFFSRIGF